jgi:hypothetical protein
MRLLVLSDIHANLEALDACMEVAPAHDSAVNLGDVVGYNASPNEVCDRVRAMGCPVVRGNHDRACAGLLALSEFNLVAAYVGALDPDRAGEPPSELAKGVAAGTVAPRRAARHRVCARLPARRGRVRAEQFDRRPRLSHAGALATSSFSDTPIYRAASPTKMARRFPSRRDIKAATGLCARN